MTHYSRYCLHLGCGEPLGRATLLLPIKRPTQAKAMAKPSGHKQHRRVTTKHK